MKRVIEYEGRKIKYYLCDNCKAEVTFLFCKVIDPSKLNRGDNWIELCDECVEKYREEVKGNEAI